MSELTKEESFLQHQSKRSKTEAENGTTAVISAHEINDTEEVKRKIPTTEADDYESMVRKEAPPKLLKEERKQLGKIRGQISNFFKSKDYDGVYNKYMELRENPMTKSLDIVSMVLHALSVSSDNEKVKTAKEIFNGACENAKAKTFLPQSRVSKQWESAYAVMIRLVSINLEQPEEGIKYFNEMLSRNITPYCRSLSPIIVGFAKQNRAEEALKYFNKLSKELEIEISEREILPMAACLARVGKKEDGFKLVEEHLNVIGGVFGVLEVKESLDHLRELFSSPSSFVDADINDLGQCNKCDQNLASIDLNESEQKKFVDSLYNIVTGKSEKAKTSLDQFISWLDSSGPYDVFIDGANVAMFNQNFSDSRFRFYQIKNLVAQIKKTYAPETKVLVVIHEGRLRKENLNSEDEQIIAEMRLANELYVVPRGNNDDWYWMYAALLALSNSKIRGHVFTNDYMRDHHFQLLNPRYFRVWRERHINRFVLKQGKFEIHPPASYSRRVQKVGDNWHFIFSETSVKEEEDKIQEADVEELAIDDATVAVAEIETKKETTPTIREKKQKTYNFSYKGKVSWFCAHEKKLA